MNILIIDNYDSFTGNLEHLIALTTGERPEITLYDSLAQATLEMCDLVVISAGPGKPSDYPAYRDLLDGNIPVLGICLGMQVINEYFGGTTAPLPGCVHGQTDSVLIDNRSFTVARYHSLYADTIGHDLEVFGQNADGVPMALRHRTRPIIGYQFHPESFLTPEGAYFVRYAVESLRFTHSR